MTARWMIAALLILLCLSRPAPMWGQDELAHTTAPIFIVHNLADQVNLFGPMLSMIGATLIRSSSPVVACEMLDDRANIVGAAFLSDVFVWMDGTPPYALSIELDPVSGSLEVDYYPDDSAEGASVEEHSDAYGITMIAYRGMPIGPIIGERYVYRPLLRQQTATGQWRLLRDQEDSKALLTVGPPYAANMAIAGSSGTLASFYFWSPIGADGAIIQVTRAPYYDFPPDQRYQQSIPGNWTAVEEHALNSVEVDLSWVPGTESLYLWRIGARSSENAVLPQPLFGVGSDWGWVWSQASFFVYETGRFSDLPTLHWAYSEIEACAEAGVVAGYGDGTYKPELPVTRDQMAVYISRALAGGDSSVPDFTDTPTFPDVGATHWALKYIEYAVDQAVVTGYDDGNYHPEYEVTRDQMAVYVARSLVAPTGEAALADYVPADPRNFPDAPDTFWAYKHIEYCVEHGVVNGYDDGLYHPEIIVTRDQMAVYIARAFGL